MENLLLVGILLCAVVALFVLKKMFLPSASGGSILFLGEVGSGKTVMLFQLYQNVVRDTVTSQKENILKFVPDELVGVKRAAEYQYIDFPGHGSVRYKLEKFLSSAKAVVFVVDSAAPEKFQAAAERLYHVLVALVSRKHVPLLVALNKVDKTSAVDHDKTKNKLESYIEQTRHLQSSVATLGDDQDAKAVEVGVAGKPFTFEDVPFKVQLCSLSGLERKSLVAVTDFIASC
mmetsp:Transcript_14707/g.20839  ORF Transcript_14707/g.20839 Transcript_14707/m.20839 type:complete len:232 (-) Transcript_14707:72-767(-)|eukprot:CAMPEP_0175090762 /NCGR_PEP_ID=MMETSP0086_2-20121207/1533_1 /TAXON_ID=136419 /ORGANISM="Unknown Unknown, Strain D1" /LENGTH=231 /DNA_ID=CAMNT_0016363441 /DNA_START=9 /DNA_END=704 /DNA_ORIENTATION=-